MFTEGEMHLRFFTDDLIVDEENTTVQNKSSDSLM